MEGLNVNKMASSASAGSIFEESTLGVFVTPHKAEEAGYSPQKGSTLPVKQTHSKTPTLHLQKQKITNKKNLLKVYYKLWRVNFKCLSSLGFLT